MATYTVRSTKHEDHDNSECEAELRKLWDHWYQESPADRGSPQGTELISLSDTSDDTFPEIDVNQRPFPTEHLPDIAGKLVRAFRKRTNDQTPDALPAMAAIGTLSAAIGPGLLLEGLEGLTGGCGLYILAGACSSSGKSMILDQTFKPLEKIGLARSKKFEQGEKPRLERDLRELEKQKEKSAEDWEKIGDLKQRIECKPRLSCEDATTPAMVRLMARQSNDALSSISDEARDPIKNLLGKHTKGKTDEGFLTKAWSSKLYQCDRVTDSFEATIEEPWLSILWFTQPDQINQMATSPDLLYSGFFQRLLICDTKAYPAIITGPSVPESILNQWGDLLRDLHDSFRIAKSKVVVQPTEAARQLFNKYAQECVDRMNGDLEEVHTIPGKWNENAIRLALTFHAAEYGRDAPAHLVSESTASKAIKVMRWFADEMLAIVWTGISTQRRNRATALQKVIENHSPNRDGLTLGKLKNNHKFEESEIRKLCAEFPHLLALVEIRTTHRGGRNSARCILADWRNE